MGKKKKAKSHPNHVYKIYKISGDKVEKKNQECPKCGSGVFMAQHGNRVSCGRCGFTEFKTKK